MKKTDGSTVHRFATTLCATLLLLAAWPQPAAAEPPTAAELSEARRWAAAKFEGGKAVVSFTHLGGGLVAPGGALRGFEVAGADGVFHPATARIVGATVELNSPAVAAPVAVRYGWANVPDCNLFNAAGLPASPFRAGQQVFGLQDG